MTFQVVTELTTSVTANIGSGEGSMEVDLFNFPIWRTPDVQIGRGLPAIRTGFYFEAALVADSLYNFFNPLVYTGKAIAKLAKFEVTFAVSGPITSLPRPTLTSRIIEQTSFRQEFSAPDLFDELSSTSFTAFIGVRPRISFYAVGTFWAKVYLTVGVKGVAEIMLPATNALPPNPNGAFGICDSCHHLQLTGNLKLQVAAFEVGVELQLLDYIDYNTSLFKENLPGNPCITQVIAVGCFIKQYGDDQELCGDQCCNNEEE